MVMRENLICGGKGSAVEYIFVSLPMPESNRTGKIV